MSITDVCNYKCTYCLPQGYKKSPGDMRKFMSSEEISRLTKALSELYLKVLMTPMRSLKNLVTLLKTIRLILDL